jgi:hypothetical protein
MASQITAADILKQREEERKACRLAHSPNGDGDFWARHACPCYTCRDVLDPTGEQDAATANATHVTAWLLGTDEKDWPPLATPPPPPPPAPLEESNHLEDAIHSLKLLIEHLRKKQDTVYESDTRSHDEMAAQDMEWNEYDTKIMSVEQAIDILENFA